MPLQQTLVQAKVEVRLKKTWTIPDFAFAYADPAKDNDVSSQMHHINGVEIPLTKLWYRKIHKCCAQKGALVLDVGANLGWYSLYAATLGCRVIAWEPVPLFKAFFQVGIEANKLEDSIEIRSRGVLDQPSGHSVDILVPEAGNWGTASINGANADACALGLEKNDCTRLTVQTERLDDVIRGEGPDVCMLKIDVEGYEPQVLKSAEKLITSRRVKNIMLEYSPGVFERLGRAVNPNPAETNDYYQHTSAFPEMLQELIANGYTLRHVDCIPGEGAWPCAKGNGGLRYANDTERWEAVWEQFHIIDEKQLAHDLRDANLLARSKGRVGNATKWGIEYSTQSFRARFGQSHNTDVLASL
ncbi:hypothetical protein CYMTET_51926 [Cymbomonas tetramitiformis]|uniref:Methyltransferase FkbM domain-containing protein n=1 Tax=Cymbomonas tetramitiformis TaxID=36881 RepID=A0AAE0BK18_9CHLO|nr:hypothetical protein CYMTET_51926 [Cymbomonas tetramitiformis]